jgi:hypothetical protein
VRRSGRAASVGSSGVARGRAPHAVHLVPHNKRLELAGASAAERQCDTGGVAAEKENGRFVWGV